LIAEYSTKFLYETFELFIARETHLEKSVNKSNNNVLLVFLFSIIGLGIISLTISATMANAQTSSNSMSGGNRASKETNVKQMGICLVGEGGPCNGDSNWDGTHDVTGKCVLLNGCGNGNPNNKESINNNVRGK
jgi:hypothetical protein